MASRCHGSLYAWLHQAIFYAYKARLGIILEKIVYLAPSNKRLVCLAPLNAQSWFRPWLAGTGQVHLLHTTPPPTPTSSPVRPRHRKFHLLLRGKVNSDSSPPVSSSHTFSLMIVLACCDSCLNLYSSLFIQHVQYAYARLNMIPLILISYTIPISSCYTISAERIKFRIPTMIWNFVPYFLRHHV